MFWVPLYKYKKYFFRQIMWVQRPLKLSVSRPTFAGQFHKVYPYPCPSQPLNKYKPLKDVLQGNMDFTEDTEDKLWAPFRLPCILITVTIVAIAGG